MNPPIMLSIAGSDPSGGAGIQADLKTATALGVYGAAVITSLTVQNTRGVSGIHAVPADFVGDQIAAVLEDLDVAAIKIGMLATADIAAKVATVLNDHRGPAIVLDPVMIATSGDRLVTEEVTAVIKEQLLPLCTVITPNLPEAATLLDQAPPASVGEMSVAAQEIRALGAAAALVKGGHLTQPKEPTQPKGPEPVEGLETQPKDPPQFKGPEPVEGLETQLWDPMQVPVLRQAQDPRRAGQDRRAANQDPGAEVIIDVLADNEGLINFSAPYVATANTHGTGCTLSSAIASELARGTALRGAVEAARTYLTGALRAGSSQHIGSGSGPVDHLWQEHIR